MPQGDQWLRKASLIVSAGSKGIDLSELRFKFEIRQSDVSTPNSAFVRVYNVKAATQQVILKEFNRVTVQAGYQTGAFGVVFDGTIKQVRHGRENNTDSYVDILAADGDLFHNFGLVNATLAAGASPQDQVNAIAQSGAAYGVTAADPQGLLGGVLPRGKVLFGLGVDQLRDIGATTGTTWSIQNGTITAVPLTGYLPGEAVVLNSQTGLVGMPEVTQNGISATCLLNPKIRIGTRIQINNKDINRTVVEQQGFPAWGDLQFFASESADGVYRVLVCEHEGDTRGNAWYSRLVCLAIDTSAPVDSSVLAYG